MAIDSGFFHAGPLLALGMLESALPKALGGRPKRAQELFTQAVEQTQGQFLLAKVLLARSVAVALGERPSFEQTLRDVIDYNVQDAPELGLANRIAQRRAARYLAQADDLFL